jgi:hypothetical protein
MKQYIPIRRFEYCIPAADGAVDGIKKVSIDFEKGELSLIGDIILVRDKPRKLWRARSTSARERIEVTATIYPGLSVSLPGFSADELIFTLEGTMRNSRHIYSCTGLLVLENLTDRQGPEGQEWHATLYFYDDRCDGREIKFRLTMYSLLMNPELN